MEKILAQLEQTQQDLCAITNRTTHAQVCLAHVNAAVDRARLEVQSPKPNVQSPEAPNASGATTGSAPAAAPQK